jgi:hypothetical protein
MAVLRLTFAPIPALLAAWGTQPAGPLHQATRHASKKQQYLGIVDWPVAGWKFGLSSDGQAANLQSWLTRVDHYIARDS